MLFDTPIPTFPLDGALHQKSIYGSWFDRLTHRVSMKIRSP